MSEQMARLGRRDTRPEIALRKELHARGLRYRVDVTPIRGLRGRADIVFGPSRVAVYVDGCFWHRCPQHAVMPRNNGAWWLEKLQTNVDRDRRTNAELRSAGWEVVRIWEHEDPLEAARRVEEAVRSRRRATPGSR